MPSLDELLHEIKRIEKSREVLTEEKIRAIYRSLIDDLEQYLSKTYKQYADDDGRLYVHYLDSKNKRAKFLQEIAANVDALSVPLKAHITKLVNSTYEETYKGMINAFKKAEDIAQFAKLTKDIDVNPRVLKQAINNNISKLTLPPVLEKHRNELVYQMQQELNIGLMNGDRYEKMAKRISERCGVSYNKAMNITRTETHRNVESGFMDGAEYIQENLDGSGMIYAAIWRTMKDERVRPWKRVRTKHGWKIIKKETGANHRKMEGVTVKAGELFDLGGGVKAKAPSQSGVAAHDCRCRCFLEYKMMTVDEFAEATNQTKEKVMEKYSMNTEQAERQNNIAHIKQSEVYANIPDKYKDAIYKSIDEMDDETLSIVSKTIDNVNVQWDEGGGTAFYRKGTGNITMYEYDESETVRTFWHEYGHFVDDDEISKLGMKTHIERFTSRSGRVSEYKYKGNSAWAEYNGYNDASKSDIERILKKISMDDLYEVEVSEYGQGVYIKRRSDGAYISFDDISVYDDAKSLQKSMDKLLDDITGMNKANNYLYDNGMPRQPKRDDYFVTYTTPKRQTVKTKERYKGAQEAYYNAQNEYWDARDAFEKSPEYETLIATVQKLRESAERNKSKMLWITDVLDGGCNGAFGMFLSWGGHTADYYGTSYGTQNNIKESVANAFMVKALNDEDMIKFFKELMPETYKLMLNAWSW